MTKKAIGLVSCAAFGLTACGVKAPTGQVVATVNDEEVTIGELRAEAAAQGLPGADDPVVRSELLRDVVDRKLRVQEARRGKLDRQIEFVLAKRRAEEVLLAGLLTRTFSDSVPPPSEGDVDRFLRENPTAFSSRTVFQIDQIDFRSDGELPIAGRLKEAKSLDEVDRLLTASGIVSQRSRTEWNSLFMPADLATRLRRLPPGGLFLHRDGDVVVAGVVTAKSDASLSPRNREILARRSLTQRKVEAAVAERLDKLRTSARISRQPAFPIAAP